MSKHKFNCGVTALRKGRGDVTDNALPVRPSVFTTDEHIEAVKKMILNNRRITIREVADDVGILFGLCKAIFTDVLGMKRSAAKIPSKLLYFEQRLRHMDMAQEMLTPFNSDPDLLKKVITGDVSWVYGFDIEDKAQSFQWKRPE